MASPLLAEQGVQSPIAPHPSVGRGAVAQTRYASLIVVFVCAARVLLVRRVAGRIFSAVARAGMSVLRNLGYVRRQALVPIVNLGEQDSTCVRTLISFERAAGRARLDLDLRFVQCGDLRDPFNPSLPLRAFMHPASESLRRADALVVAVDLTDDVQMADVRGIVHRASILAERHRRRVPLLLLARQCDAQHARPLEALRGLLGPRHALPAPWHIARVLFAGRRDRHSPLSVLPDEMIATILRRVQVGSAWGAPYVLTCASVSQPAQGADPARARTPAGMCCWDGGASGMLVVALPSAAEDSCACVRAYSASAMRDSRSAAGAVGSEQEPAVCAVLAHGVRWLTAQVAATAPWAWCGPSPTAIEWSPAASVRPLPRPL